MKAVLLNSGGKDCLAAAVLTRNEYELHSLTIDPGNPSSAAERAVAAKIAAKYAASHKVIEVTGGPYEVVSRFGYPVLAGKCMVVHALGAMYAWSIGADVVVSGQRNDVVADDFAARLESVFSMSKHRPGVRLVCPLGADGTDTASLLRALADEPLLVETVYCLKDPPCGTCPRCRARAHLLAPPMVVIRG